MLQWGMSTRYKLLFRGEVAKDQHPSIVRGRLQALLKASDAQLEVLFSGKPISIKKDVDEAVAERYLDAFVKAGAKLEIVELDAAAIADMNRKAEMEAAARAHKAQQAKAAIEDAQAQAQESAQEIAQEQAQEQAPSVASPDSPTASFGVALGLAEVGSDIVPAEARSPTPVVSVPTDHLSLAETGGNLVEATETAQTGSPPAVDTSHLSLDAAGATLGVPKEVTPLLDTLVDLDYELSDVGALLVETAPVAAPEIPDLSHFELERLPE